MPSSATLSSLRDRLEITLQDSGNATWSTADLDEALAQALEQYSRANPRRAIATLTLSSAGREVSLASVAGLLSVERVWWAYTAAAPEYPPHWREFELWPGPLLFIRAGAQPQAGDVVRIWYTALHTLNGLNGATATTYPTGHDWILLAGAAARAALARAAGLGERLNVDGGVRGDLRAWAAAQEERFRAALAEVARAEAARASGLAGLASLDRWDGPEWA